MWFQTRNLTIFSHTLNKFYLAIKKTLIMKIKVSGEYIIWNNVETERETMHLIPHSFWLLNVCVDVGLNINRGQKRWKLTKRGSKDFRGVKRRYSSICDMKVKRRLLKKKKTKLGEGQGNSQVDGLDEDQLKISS